MCVVCMKLILYIMIYIYMYPGLTATNNALASIITLAVYNASSGIASWAKSMTALMLLATVLLVDSLFYGESK